MTKTKTLGRADDNDVKFPDPHIGRYHAKVTVLDNGHFVIEDLNSTNGTFVNGHRIVKATITLKDKVALADTTVDLAGIFHVARDAPKKTKTDPKDFTEEFMLLKKVYEDYKLNKRTVIKSHQKKASLIRAAITVAPIPIYYSLEHFFPESKNIYLPLSVTASTIAMYVTGNMSSHEDLDQLDESFCVTYVCPACKKWLGHVPWSVYQRQGKCQCTAIYSKQ